LFRTTFSPLPCISPPPLLDTTCRLCPMFRVFNLPLSVLCKVVGVSDYSSTSPMDCQATLPDSNLRVSTMFLNSVYWASLCFRWCLNPISPLISLPLETITGLSRLRSLRQCAEWRILQRRHFPIRWI
jgi:hypothetical protein